MNDLKFAFRQLLKNPGFTAVAVLAVALGIGSCTATFSVVHAVLLRPLPFREPKQLVWIQNVGTDGLSGRSTRVDNFLEWREQNNSFEELGAYFAFFDYARFTLTEPGEPQRRPGTYPIAFPRMVDHRYLQTMRIPLRSGRHFDARGTADTGKVIRRTNRRSGGRWICDSRFSSGLRN